MHFTQYDTRVGAYALIFDGDRVLLSWLAVLPTQEVAAWTLPGGGVEFGEQLESAVVREVFEETGYKVELDGYLTSHSFAQYATEDRRPFSSVRVIFTAHIVGGSLGTVEVDGSTERAEWIHLDRLDEAGPRVELVDVALDAWRRRSE